MSIELEKTIKDVVDKLLEANVATDLQRITENGFYRATISATFDELNKVSHLAMRLVCLVHEFRVIGVSSRGVNVEDGRNIFNKLIDQLCSLDRISVAFSEDGWCSLKSINDQNDERIYQHANKGHLQARFIRPDYGVSDQPLFVHVHIPKNGGSSFHEIMISSFGTNYLPLYYEDPQRQHTYATLQRHIIENPKVEAIASHSIKHFPHRFGSRIPLYICFLRNPIERALSYFRYLKKDWDDLPSEMKMRLPSNFPEMSAGEFFDYQAKEDLRHGISQDRQTFFLSHTRNWKRAVDVLSRFFFVGTTESYFDSLTVLKYRSEQIGLNLKIDLSNIPHSNSTVNLSEDYSDARIQEYFKEIRSDLKLYDWAQSQLNEALKEIIK